MEMVLWATGVLMRSNAILEDYSSRTNIAASPVDTTTKMSSVSLSYVPAISYARIIDGRYPVTASFT